MTNSSSCTVGAFVFTSILCCAATSAQTVHATHESVGAATKVAVSGPAFAFLADEATTGINGTDLNGDGDKLDSVAVVVDMQNASETVLGVQASDLAWIGSELYLVTSEAQDGRDWNGNATLGDLVLLHWSAAAPVLVHVDTLAAAGSPKMVAVGTALFYTRETAPAGATLSNLRVIRSSQPLVTTMVATTDVQGSLSPRILAQDEGLLFLALDETFQGRDLNSDGDLIDGFVLALCDGTAATPVIRSTGFAIAGASTPLRARKTGPNDWSVGFLVSEAAQGNTNLNSPSLFSSAWQAPQCVGHADTDTSDDVLHFLQFAAWNSNPVAFPARNTGLVGTRKIAIANGVIATISPEADEGTCDLNQDGDLVDDVVRMTPMVAAPAPVLPLNDANQIHALFDAPGGTHGLAELTNRFVIEVSESADGRDINGDALLTFDLIGWMLPQTSPLPWDFTPSVSSVFAGGSWISEEPDRAHLDVAFEERVGGVPINGGDSDTLDSVPTVPMFANPSTLSFPGVPVAVERDDAGILIARNFVFFRVNESDDNRDWNQDGDLTDRVLLRASLLTGITSTVGTLNALGRPSIETSRGASDVGFAFLSDEQAEGSQGTDFNGDGDRLDLVVRWMRFVPDCNGNGVDDDVDIGNGTSADCNGNGVPDECDIAGSTSTDANGDGVPDECQAGGTGFCFGDGSGTACPCSNFGGGENGCANSANTGGAHLAASGLPSVTADSLVLDGSGMTNTSSALYFQGTLTVNGGSGTIFGDGLRCAGGSVIRLGTETNSSGASHYPSTGNMSISLRGSIPAGGGVTRTYQARYRDVQPFCTSNAFNLTNGVLVQWVP